MEYHRIISEKVHLKITLQTVGWGLWGGGGHIAPVFTIREDLTTSLTQSSFYPDRISPNAVSYTHLTLPTTILV